MPKKITELTAASTGDLGATTSYLETSINTTTTPLSRKVAYGVLALWLATVGFLGTDLNLNGADASTYIVAGKGAQSIATNTAFGVRALSSIAADTSFGENAAFGWEAGKSINEGGFNSAFGSKALNGCTTGGTNTALGNAALYATTIGSYNTAVGVHAMVANIDGNYNTVVGRNAFSTSISGNFNAIFGFNAYEASLGDHSIAMGAYAGTYETGQSKFYIDSYDRGDEATGRASALLYGVIDATPANQTLLTNAAFSAAISIDTPLYKVGGVSGADFTGAVAGKSFTVVKGLVTVVA